MKRSSKVLLAIAAFAALVVFVAFQVRPHTYPPEIVWTRHLDSLGSGSCSGIAFDGKGQLRLYGSLDRDPPAGSDRAKKGGRNSVGFIARIDEDGNPVKVAELGESISRLLPSSGADESIHVVQNSEDVYRLAPDGKHIWRKSYFSDHGWYIKSIVPNGPRGIYVVGNTWDQTIEEPFVIKLDASGKTVWTRMLASEVGSTPSNSPMAYDAALDPDGNLIVAGDGFVLKLNPGGRLLWKVSEHRYAYLVRASREGIYVQYVSDYTGRTARLVKYDAHGTMQWYRQVRTSGVAISQDMVLDSAGNLYVVQSLHDDDGKTLSNLVTKWRPDGLAAWRRFFPTQNDTTFSGLTVGAGGDIYICGNIDANSKKSNGKGSRMLLMKLRQHATP